MGNPGRRPATDPRFAVGVVVPTIGRSRLTAAVVSALEQTIPPAAIVVVCDGPTELIRSVQLPDDPRIQLISSLPASGLSAARNAGVRHLGTPLIALLDDDDEWLPTKLELQLAAYRKLLAEGIAHPLVSCRAVIQDWWGGQLATAPIDLIAEGQSVGDYLFRRRHIRRRGALLLPSTLLFDAALAKEVPFDESLTISEDWDWLLRLGARPDTKIKQVDEALARYTEHEGGNSRQRGWQMSRAWTEAITTPLSASERSDCLICDVAPKALVTGDLVAYFAILSRARSIGGASPRAWMYALVGIFAFALTDRAGRWARRARRSLSGRR